MQLSRSFLCICTAIVIAQAAELETAAPSTANVTSTLSVNATAESASPAPTTSTPAPPFPCEGLIGERYCGGVPQCVWLGELRRCATKEFAANYSSCDQLAMPGSPESAANPDATCEPALNPGCQPCELLQYCSRVSGLVCSITCIGLMNDLEYCAASPMCTVFQVQPGLHACVDVMSTVMSSLPTPPTTSAATTGAPPPPTTDVPTTLAPAVTTQAPPSSPMATVAPTTTVPEAATMTTAAPAVTTAPSTRRVLVSPSVTPPFSEAPSGAPTSTPFLPAVDAELKTRTATSSRSRELHSKTRSLVTTEFFLFFELHGPGIASMLLRSRASGAVADDVEAAFATMDAMVTTNSLSALSGDAVRANLTVRISSLSLVSSTEIQATFVAHVTKTPLFNETRNLLRESGSAASSFLSVPFNSIAVHEANQLLVKRTLSSTVILAPNPTDAPAAVAEAAGSSGCQVGCIAGIIVGVVVVVIAVAGGLYYARMKQKQSAHESAVSPKVVVPSSRVIPYAAEPSGDDEEMATKADGGERSKRGSEAEADGFTAIAEQPGGDPLVENVNAVHQPVRHVDPSRQAPPPAQHQQDEETTDTSDSSDTDSDSDESSASTFRLPPAEVAANGNGVIYTRVGRERLSANQAAAERGGIDPFVNLEGIMCALPSPARRPGRDLEQVDSAEMHPEGSSPLLHEHPSPPDSGESPSLGPTSPQLLSPKSLAKMRHGRLPRARRDTVTVAHEMHRRRSVADSLAQSEVFSAGSPTYSLAGSVNPALLERSQEVPALGSSQRTPKADSVNSAEAMQLLEQDFPDVRMGANELPPSEGAAHYLSPPMATMGGLEGPIQEALAAQAHVARDARDLHSIGEYVESEGDDDMSMSMTPKARGVRSRPSPMMRPTDSSGGGSPLQGIVEVTVPPALTGGTVLQQSFVMDHGDFEALMGDAPPANRAGAGRASFAAAAVASGAFSGSPRPLGGSRRRQSSMLGASMSPLSDDAPPSESGYYYNPDVASRALEVNLDDDDSEIKSHQGSPKAVPQDSPIRPPFQTHAPPAAVEMSAADVNDPLHMDFDDDATSSQHRPPRAMSSATPINDERRRKIEAIKARRAQQMQSQNSSHDFSRSGSQTPSMDADEEVKERRRQRLAELRSRRIEQGLGSSGTWSEGSTPSTISTMPITPQLGYKASPNDDPVRRRKIEALKAKMQQRKQQQQQQQSTPTPEAVAVPVANHGKEHMLTERAKKIQELKERRSQASGSATTSGTQSPALTPTSNGAHDRVRRLEELRQRRQQTDETTLLDRELDAFGQSPSETPPPANAGSHGPSTENDRARRIQELRERRLAASQSPAASVTPASGSESPALTPTSSESKAADRAKRLEELRRRRQLQQEQQQHSDGVTDETSLLDRELDAFGQPPAATRPATSEADRARRLQELRERRLQASQSPPASVTPASGSQSPALTPTSADSRAARINALKEKKKAAAQQSPPLPPSPGELVMEASGTGNLLDLAPFDPEEGAKLLARERKLQELRAKRKQKSADEPTSALSPPTGGRISDSPAALSSTASFHGTLPPPLTPSMDNMEGSFPATVSNRDDDAESSLLSESIAKAMLSRADSGRFGSPEPSQTKPVLSPPGDGGGGSLSSPPSLPLSPPPRSMSLMAAALSRSMDSSPGAADDRSSLSRRKSVVKFDLGN